MQANEAIEMIFKQSGWSMTGANLSNDSESKGNNHYDALLLQASQAYRVELSQYNLDLAIFNQSALFCSCQLLDIPNLDTNNEQYVDLLKQACAMVALINMERPIKLVLHDTLLCLETIIDLEVKDPIKCLSLFLDDCDYFFENIIKSHSILQINDISNEQTVNALSLTQTSQKQFEQMSPSLQYFLGVTP